MNANAVEFPQHASSGCPAKSFLDSPPCARFYQKMESVPL